MSRKGFTLMEVMAVVVILGILIALLLPAVSGAMRTARNAATSAEINQMVQALAAFKSKHGVYPPSRFLAVEDGNYGPYLGDTTPLNGGTLTDPTSPGTGDVALGMLASRSVRFLRTAFPRMSTTGLPSGVWYDFNGDGARSRKPYILHGHECLVLFLGGVPHRTKDGNYGVSGLGKDPTNPFTNAEENSPMYSANRQEPFFAFSPARLVLDPASGVSGTTWVGTGIPGFTDMFVGPAGTPGFYAYFAADGGYDPNDVNFLEADDAGATPLSLTYARPTSASGGPCISPGPNPYTASATTEGTVVYQAPQTFQILSAGADGLFGVGGQWRQATTDATDVLPFDAANTTAAGSPETDATIRRREWDNLTSFKARTLR